MLGAIQSPCALQNWLNDISQYVTRITVGLVRFCFADAATADASRAAFGGERIEGDERGR